MGGRRHQEADPQAGNQPGGPGAGQRDRGRYSRPARGARRTEGEEAADSGGRREGDSAGSGPRVGEALVDALPLLDVDWELVSDHDFRDLLAALNFEASYEPTKRELTIRVTLVPELTSPGGERAPLLFVPLIQPLSNSDWVDTLSELVRKATL